MSIKKMAEVWELDLPQNKLLVLLALADHANDEGRNVFPSVKRVAWKTGYSPRQIQRVLRQLEEDSLLIKESEGGGTQPRKYRIDTSAVPAKVPFEDLYPHTRA